MDWNPAQYLKFDEERTQVSRDLARRVAQRLPSPRQVIDLGCGPGNSTEVLAQTWPGATITGLDASGSMLAAARGAHPELHFVEGDIVAWSRETEARYDVVFTNSALQWIPEYAGRLPALLARVAPGGALALQVPANWDAPACQIPRDLATEAAWQRYFPPGKVAEWRVEPLARLYEALAGVAARVEMWETTYVHILSGVEGILEWYRGSGLRPYLEALPDEAARESFLAACRERLGPAYPAQSNGQVLFPFRRRFVIAWAGTGAGPAA